MTWIAAALWGLFGGFAVEGLELYTAVRRYRIWPWQVKGIANRPREPGWPAYVVAEVLRLAIGSGLAWAALANHQITGPFGAIAVGAAAPYIIGELTKGIPLTEKAGVPTLKIAAQPAEQAASGDD